MTTRIPVAVLLALTAAQVQAQSLPNPGGMAPDTPRMESGSPPKDHANTQDKLFVRQAAIGNRAEVELGKLAQQKGSSDAVRDFAKRMQTDHGKAGDQLMRVGKQAEPSIPKELDPEHVRVREELNRASGKDFDVAYLTSQVRDHQKTANLLLWEISFGQNANLTKYAADALPTVMEHMEIAKQQLAALRSPPTPER
jgi:putative membrane protein